MYCEAKKWNEMNFLGFRETWRRVESSHLLATSSHVRSRQPGNTNGRISLASQTLAIEGGSGLMPIWQRCNRNAIRRSRPKCTHAYVNIAMSAKLQVRYSKCSIQSVLDAASIDLESNVGAIRVLNSDVSYKILLESHEYQSMLTIPWHSAPRQPQTPQSYLYKAPLSKFLSIFVKLVEIPG